MVNFHSYVELPELTPKITETRLLQWPFDKTKTLLRQKGSQMLGRGKPGATRRYNQCLGECPEITKHIWKIHGKSMENPWKIHGKSMENPWFSQDMIYKCCVSPCFNLCFKLQDPVSEGQTNLICENPKCPQSCHQKRAKRQVSPAKYSQFTVCHFKKFKNPRT